MQIYPQPIYGTGLTSIPRVQQNAKLVGIPVELWLESDPGVITLDALGNGSVFPPAAINPYLNKTFNITESQIVSSFTITITGTGDILNKSIVCTEGTISLVGFGTYIPGVTIASLPGTITISGVASDVDVEIIKRNWVKWSNIGSLSFTVGKDNIAGERPLDWKGWVYDIRKLGSKVIVYGQNGISALIPSGNTFGLQSIFQLGLKGKQAVCGNDSEHYFVDVKSQLWKLSNSLEKLDYSECLGNLSSTITMSLDKETGLIYICDGCYGYVYSPRSQSMGECSPYITGTGSQGGTQYVTASQTIASIPLEIQTDIFDFGTRNGKTIRSLQIGTDATGGLYAAIDYRRDKAESWGTTNWETVTSEGIAFITCYGVEFRFKFKNLSWEEISPDYITVKGTIHGH